jgi:hypothetical protein
MEQDSRIYGKVAGDKLSLIDEVYKSEAATNAGNKALGQRGSTTSTRCDSVGHHHAHPHWNWGCSRTSRGGIESHAGFPDCAPEQRVRPGVFR